MHLFFYVSFLWISFSSHLGNISHNLIRYAIYWIFFFLSVNKHCIQVEANWNRKNNLKRENSPKLSGIPDGPGKRPGRPRKLFANDEVLESIDPFINPSWTSPMSDAIVSLLFESSPVLCVCNDFKSWCCLIHKRMLK